MEHSGPQGTTRSAPLALLAEELTMSYGGRRALQGLSFELRPGHVMGFLGPNGAGKTTSIRILTTILRPSSGHFAVDGISSDQPAKIRPRIGVLPESLGLPNQITGIEYISYFGRLYGRKAPMEIPRSRWAGIDTRRPTAGRTDGAPLTDESDITRRERRGSS